MVGKKKKGKRTSPEHAAARDAAVPLHSGPAPKPVGDVRGPKRPLSDAAKASVTERLKQQELRRKQEEERQRIKEKAAADARAKRKEDYAALRAAGRVATAAGANAPSTSSAPASTPAPLPQAPAGVTYGSNPQLSPLGLRTATLYLPHASAQGAPEFVTFASDQPGVFREVRYDPRATVWARWDELVAALTPRAGP